MHIIVARLEFNVSVFSLCVCFSSRLYVFFVDASSMLFQYQTTVMSEYDLCNLVWLIL